MFSTNLPRMSFMKVVRNFAALPLELQVGAVYLFDWKGDLIAARQLDCNGVVFRPRNHAIEVLEFVVKRLLQDHLDLLACKTSPILPFRQLALDARRTDLELIRAGDGVFRIENRADPAGHEFAIGGRHAIRPVDVDAEEMKSEK